MVPIKPSELLQNKAWFFSFAYIGVLLLCLYRPLPGMLYYNTLLHVSIILVASGNQLDVNALVWVSSTRLLNGVWIWRTNYKPVTYTNFETKSVSHQDQCNVFRVANGSWFNTSCTEYKMFEGNFSRNVHSVVCEPISEKVSYANLQYVGADDKARAMRKRLHQHQHKHLHHHHRNDNQEGHQQLQQNYSDNLPASPRPVPGTRSSINKHVPEHGSVPGIPSVMNKAVPEQGNIISPNDIVFNKTNKGPAHV